MPEVTLEKSHALLEKLVEYVMNELPTRKEVDNKFKQIDNKFKQIDNKFQKVDNKFQRVYDAIRELKEEKADKKDVEILKMKIEKMLEGQDEIIKQLDIIRTEQYATSASLDRYEKRLETLEANNMPQDC